MYMCKFFNAFDTKLKLHVPVRRLGVGLCSSLPYCKFHDPRDRGFGSLVNYYSEYCLYPLKYVFKFADTV